MSKVTSRSWLSGKRWTFIITILKAIKSSPTILERKDQPLITIPSILLSVDAIGLILSLHTSCLNSISTPFFISSSSSLNAFSFLTTALSEISLADSSRSNLLTLPVLDFCAVPFFWVLVFLAGDSSVAAPRFLELGCS